MFTTKQKTPIDREIDRLARILHATDADTEEYAKILKRMSSLRKIEAEKPAPDRLSLNTAAMITANLLGIAFVTVWERENVITSKAFGWILKAGRTT